MRPFRSGIGLLATRLDLPVVPMRIDGLFPFKAQEKHYAPPGAIQVCVGDPIKFEPGADAEATRGSCRRSWLNFEVRNFLSISSK